MDCFVFHSQNKIRKGGYIKILLLGEYSHLHHNLKEGLQEHGHHVVVASGGDGWKGVPRDIDLKSKIPGIIGKIHNLILPYQALNSLKGFDVVQLINPFVFYNRLIPNRTFYRKIIDNNNSFFLLAAGDDAYYWRYARKKLKYGPFDDFLKFDLKSNNFFMMGDHAFKFNEFIARKACGVIPINYEYMVGYNNFPNVRPIIPIPMNLSKIQMCPNRINRKIVIFHGLNRYGFKGTRHVESAFNTLNRRYPNEVELVIDGHLPLQEYLDIMRRANVVIDQTNSYSLGVNGVYALAMGKIVMGGAEKEALDSVGLKDSPVINIEPDPADIIQKIEILIEKKNQFEEMGYNSRLFCELNHCHLMVANKYANQWLQINHKKLE